MDIDHSQVSCYSQIGVINEDHRIFLVQDAATGQLAVRKELAVFNEEIYLRLMKQHVPGTPAILAMERAGDRLIIVEEFISGRTLEEKIAAGLVTGPAAVSCLKELCLILNRLHSMKPAIIHRDLKPSNIIITPAGKPVLIDFNAAKWYSADKSTDTVLLGTEGYAAPEQYGFGASSPRTDIYSLGIIMKELADAAGLHSDELDSIIKKCTEMNPNDRYRSAMEVYDRLNHRPEPADGKRRLPRWLRFLPPGFRTLTIWHMLIAAPVYALIDIITVNITVEGGSVIAKFGTQAFFFLSSLAVILLSCNYLNVQHYLPLARSKKLPLKILGVILFDTLTVITFFLIALVILGIFNIIA